MRIPPQIFARILTTAYSQNKLPEAEKRWRFLAELKSDLQTLTSRHGLLCPILYLYASHSSQLSTQAMDDSSRKAGNHHLHTDNCVTKERRILVTFWMKLETRSTISLRLTFRRSGCVIDTSYENPIHTSITRLIRKILHTRIIQPATSFSSEQFLAQG